MAKEKKKQEAEAKKKAEAKAKAAKEKKNREIIKNILQNIPSNASEMFKTTPLLG